MGTAVTPRSSPPLPGGESSTASAVSLARLSDVAARHREELQFVSEVELVREPVLVPEVEVEEIGGTHLHCSPSPRYMSWFLASYCIFC